jgi:glycosyltransferase involved in cell wall biosynthesis
VTRVAAIIPVLNEAGAIGPTIAGLPRAVVDAVIVVDGGSTDATVAEAEAAGAEVLVERQAGYGRACALGVAHASVMGAEVLLFLDGDGADPAEEAAHIVGPILAGEADFVLSTRTKGVREAGSMGAHQVLAGRLIGRAIWAMCGTRYSDMSAFRAIRADCLAALGMRETTYGWNLEMQMRAAHAHLRIREVPLSYRRRIAGRSKVTGNLRGTLRAGRRIVATLLRVGWTMRGGRQSGARFFGRH